jgi:nicotinamide mononucleotide transporter
MNFIKKYFDFIALPVYMTVVAVALYLVGIESAPWFVLGGAILIGLGSSFSKRESLLGPILYIMGNSFFAFYFFKIGLYGQVFSNIFFVFLSMATLLSWTVRNRKTKKYISPTFLPKTITCLLIILLTAIATYGFVLRGFLGFFDYSVMTALIIGAIIMIRKKVESWTFWLIAEIASWPMFIIIGSWLLLARSFAFFYINITAFIRWRSIAIKRNKKLCRA